jgi:hypothetical protein
LAEVTYKEGMTTVWTDGEKIKITNPVGFQHVRDNVERIFGMGEYDKIADTHYSLNESIGKFNTMSRDWAMIGGYIPQRAVEDLEAKSKDDNLIDKYFGEQ